MMAAPTCDPLGAVISIPRYTPCHQAERQADGVDQVYETRTSLKLPIMIDSISSKRAPFLISEVAPGVVCHVAATRSVPAGQAPRGTYFQIDHYDNACWYTKNHYTDSNLAEGSASITVTTDFGEWLGTASLGHLVFRLKRAAQSDHYAAISFGLRLYVYSQDHRLIATRDVSSNTIDRYQVRCVDLSSEGGRVFCTKKDTLLHFDHNLNQTNSWKIPAEQTREEVISTSPRFAQALVLLGLVGNPSNDDIKAAYRRKLLMVHPDRNPQDPLANDKTRSVIAAYELLTAPKYLDENSRYHDQLRVELTISVRAFGDEITATQSTKSPDGLHIGCYSGRSYVVKSDGTFSASHTCERPIRAIREAGPHVYLVSDGFCDVLTDGKFVGRFAHTNGRLVWGRASGMEISTKHIRLFSLRGSPYASLYFRDNISDAYLPDDQLKVVTANKVYLFSIHVPDEITPGDEARLLKQESNSWGTWRE
jgi:hypothetical protein